MGSLGFPGNPAEHLFVQDSFAYVACDSTYGPPRGLRLFVVNVSNPALPETIGSCFMPGRPNEVWVKDSFAYIAAGIGMQVVNISNPKSPELIGSFTAPYCGDIEVVDSFAYLACGDSGLYIVNVSNPSEPKLTGRLYQPDWLVISLSIQGHYAYATVLSLWPEDNFNIINISDPFNPSKVGGCFVSEADQAVSVLGCYAYTGWMRFAVINISDSANPTITGTYPEQFGCISSVFSDSVYAYITSVYAPDHPEALCGLIVLNVFNPSQSTLSVRYGAEYDNGQDVFVKDRLVYTCFNYELLILRYIIAGVKEGPKTQLVAMTLFSNIPNPFRRTAKIQFQLPEQGFVNLKVYDASGRLVKTLIQNRMVEGMHTLYWDGRDTSGRDLPSGIYLTRLTVTDSSLTNKVMILR